MEDFDVPTSLQASPGVEHTADGDPWRSGAAMNRVFAQWSCRRRLMGKIAVGPAGNAASCCGIIIRSDICHFAHYCRSKPYSFYFVLRQPLLRAII
jgi:hypothetical protein